MGQKNLKKLHLHFLIVILFSGSGGAQINTSSNGPGMDSFPASGNGGSSSSGSAGSIKAAAHGGKCATTVELAEKDGLLWCENEAPTSTAASASTNSANTTATPPASTAAAPTKPTTPPSGTTPSSN